MSNQEIEDIKARINFLHDEQHKNQEEINELSERLEAVKHKAVLDNKALFGTKWELVGNGRCTSCEGSIPEVVDILKPDYHDSFFLTDKISIHFSDGDVWIVSKVDLDNDEPLNSTNGIDRADQEVIEFLLEQGAVISSAGADKTIVTKEKEISRLKALIDLIPKA
jgi:hypothetical protein